MQNTIKTLIEITGIGLHSGKISKIHLIPAQENTGIVFQSECESIKINANFSNIICTNMSTKLAYKHFSVNVVEHLMAALWCAKIDNLIIKIYGTEIPILDGSAIEFVQLIHNAGIVQQTQPRKTLKIIKEVKICIDDKYLILSPNEHSEISIDMTINFAHEKIGLQNIIYDDYDINFITEFAPARTFGFVKELQYLQNQGLALGASINNCIGIDDVNVLNELRFSNEFVRHKVLDCIGDFFLSGYRLNCTIQAYKSGHHLHNLALNSLFNDSSAYLIV